MNKRKGNGRRDFILSAIIEDFISTSIPVASKRIVETWNIDFSSATIRNEMAKLEEENLIFSPHTSAGRVPTSKGYREFIDKMIDFDDFTKEIEDAFTEKLNDKKRKRFEREIYDIVSILTEITGEMSFATLPPKRTFYLGISKILRKPEFISNPEKSSEVIEVLEGGDEFISFLENTPLKEEEVKIIIGEENIIPKIHSCSVIFAKYFKEGFNGFLGIIGPTRMQYGLIHEAINFAKNNL